jgi:hypothetical protein
MDVAILAAGFVTAIVVGLFVAAGVLMSPSPTGNYLERELAETRARRQTTVMLAGTLLAAVVGVSGMYFATNIAVARIQAEASMKQKADATATPAPASSQAAAGSPVASASTH